MKTKTLLRLAGLGVAILSSMANVQAASVSGQVFFDLNGNGIRDTISEFGLPTWTIHLDQVSPAGPTLSAATDVNGHFSFGPLPPGTYTISAVNPSPWLQTHPTGAGNHSITLGGSDVTGQDFGCKLPNYVPTIQWQRSLGGYAAERVSDGEGTQQTADGGYVVGGDSMSPPNNGGFDYYVVRTDPLGNPLWAKNYGTSGNERLTMLRKASAGGFILVGATGYIVRLDANGDKLWDKLLPLGAYGVVETQGGGFLVCGTDGNGRVIKLDSLGTILWDKSIGGDGYDGLYYPVQNTDGSFTIAGESNSDISGDKTSPHYGNTDFWLVKLDASGNKLWDKAFGGTGTEQCQGGLGATSDGSTVMCGFSASGISGNKTSPLYGNWDVNLVKVDANGNKVWDRTYGGTAFDGIRGLQVTSDDGIVFVGQTDNGISVGGNGTKVSPYFGGGDSWLVWTDAAGNPRYDIGFGGSGNDHIRGVTLTQDGGVLLTGSTTSTDGNVTVPPHPEGNLWLVKLAALACPANALTAVFATADCTQQKITVYFSASVNPAQALVPTHYTLTGGATSVQAASFGASTLEVVLDVSGLAPGVTYTLSIAGLSDDCGNSITPSAQLTVACPGELRGKVYFERNQNCVMDSDDFGLMMWGVELNPGPQYTLTDGNGNYTFRVPAGTYTLRASPNPVFKLTPTCPAAPGTYEVTVAAGQILSGRDFGVQAPPGQDDCPDLFIGLSASSPGGQLVHIPGPDSPCCGSNFTYHIAYWNHGLGTASGVSIELHLPPQCTYVSDNSGWALGGCGANCVQWNLPNLNVNVGGFFDVVVKLECDGTKVCDESGNGGPPMLNADAHIFPKAGDCDLKDNDSHHQVRPCCSYDPNDMQVFPKGCGSAGLIHRDQELTYLAQFQNLGSGPARVVVVQDVLDEDLDLSTLEFLGSSHSNFVQIIGRELRWIFPNIYLPPAALNEPASHGYVKFRVRPLTNAPVGTVFTNNAAIYFDANEPVVTITVTNTITENPLPVAAFTFAPRPGSAGHTNDFLYTGGTAGAVFRWQFGPGAIPETSTEMNPSGVIFLAPGTRLVSLEVANGVCLAEPALATVTAGRPLLMISQNSTKVFLWWAGAGYLLEQTHDLTAPIAWQSVSMPPTVSGGWSVVGIDHADQAAFFRLVQSP